MWFCGIALVFLKLFASYFQNINCCSVIEKIVLLLMNKSGRVQVTTLYLFVMCYTMGCHNPILVAPGDTDSVKSVVE